MCRPRNRAAPGTAGLEGPQVLGATGTGATGTRGRSRTGDAESRAAPRPVLGTVAAAGPVPCRLSRAGCCRTAMPACLGGRELIRVECPGRGRGDARAAWAQAELGFRAAAVLEQRQGQMVAGLALPHLGGLGRAHSPALAAGAVVSLAGGAGQILAVWGGRRHPLSSASAPHTSRAL